jgi:hypothetical protein
VLQVPVTASVSRSLNFFTLTMEAITWVLTKATHRRIPEDGIFRLNIVSVYDTERPTPYVSLPVEPYYRLIFLRYSHVMRGNRTEIIKCLQYAFVALPCAPEVSFARYNLSLNMYRIQPVGIDTVRSGISLLLSAHSCCFRLQGKQTLATNVMAVREGGSFTWLRSGFL